MTSIYASRLYRTSKRKKQIEAAMWNPNNTQLLTQINSYLDEEYRKPEYLHPEDVEDTADSDQDVVPDDTDNDNSIPESLDPHLDEDFDINKNLVSFPTEPDFGEATEKDESAEHDEHPEEDKPEPPAEEADVASSTIVQPDSVTACSEISTSVIKGSLNNREDTKGVSRILIKDNELWIYYNDDVNLNNIMAFVIEYLSNAGYNYLEFNRLARSDNAIVFQMIEGTPVTVDKEEKQ